MLLSSILERLPFELNPTFYFSLFLSMIAIFVLKLTRTRRDKLNLPPSPPRFPFIGNLHQIGTLPHRSLKALSHKYGPLMLLHLGQKPTLVVSSAHMAREITKSHDAVFSDRPQTTAAKIILYGCKDLGFLPYGEEWRLKRKICVVELLSPKRVQSFQFVVKEEVADMVNKIWEACADRNDNNGSCVNMSDMIVAASNNIVCRCLVGQKFHSADGKRSFGDLATQISAQTVAFSFGDFFPWLRWIDVVTGLISKMNATFREVDAFFDEVIAQHKKEHGGKSEKKDFIDILHHLQEHGQLDMELSQFDLKAMIVDLFLGGSDPTATALEWAFAELMRNPGTMKKAQEEVRRVVGNKSKVEENDVRKMKYLGCVLKETLRLHPPVPLLIPRATRSSVTLGGYHVPAKTSVFVNAWAIQRDPEFWERPEEFVPERFENGQVDFRGQDFEFIPFGSGRRGCPGVSFGFASLEFALANLLHWFDWKIPETCKSGPDMDMSEAYGITCRKKVPICVQPMLHSV